MIPVTTNMSQVDELPGEEINFTIGDARWVMRSMADLYSNRELAVAREYSTNAFDAAKERAMRLGVDIPAIEVTLPSVMNPYFKVRDFGDGMSREVLRDVYTRFGDSTKRVSNDFNGMFGFGCKSAVAYTNTFTVTSIHNGIKTVAVITRKPDYAIVMKIVAESKTTEPSGTEVVVPVHNWSEFSTKTRDFYRFWKKGTVLVNGVEPEQHIGKEITEGLYYSKDWNTSYVVMGNVGYRINNPQALFINSKMNFIHFVAYVDNGDVEFTPSREDLKYTDHTKATLQKVIDDYAKQIVESAKAELSKAKTHNEAFLIWSKWRDMLGASLFKDLEFKGEKFKSDFPIKAMRYQINNSYGRAAYGIKEWNVEAMPKTLVVTDYTLTLSSRHKTMVKDYVKIKGLNINYVLFTASNFSDVKTPWITDDNFVAWEDVKAAVPKPVKVRKPSTPGNSRVPGSWDYAISTGRYTEKPVPDNGTLFYLDTKRYNEMNIPYLLRLIDTDAVVLKMPMNRKDKFLREYKADNFYSYLKSRVVTDAATLLDKRGKEIMSIDGSDRAWVINLDISRIVDPDFVRLRALIQNQDTILKDYKNNLALAREIGKWYTVKQYEPTKKSPIQNRYPLLKCFASYNHKQYGDDLYIYLNAKYAEIKESNV